MVDKKNLLLKWNEDTGKFDLTDSKDEASNGVYLELHDEEKKWLYSFMRGASLIAKRTARRAADGIAKTGYIHPTEGKRYGVECKLEEEVSQFSGLSEDITRSQRDWYSGNYKQF